VPVIDEFYVIAESGLCYYSKSKQKAVDQNLFSGIFSALISMSRQISSEGFKTSEGIKSLVLKNRKYSIAKKQGLLFVACTTPKVKDTLIHKELVEMQQIFLLRFSTAKLADWNGNVTIFRALDPQYDKYFTESAAKRMESLF